MMDKSKELQKTQKVTPIDRPAATPATLFQLAFDQGADLDRLEKLMALKEQWEKGEAKKAYTVAMADFKKHPPEITKDHHVKYTTKAGNVVEYDHATLGPIMNALNVALGEQELSVAWDSKQAPNLITVTCRVTHALGHFEETSLSAAPDDSGGKNAIQAIASTVSYLQRYTIMAITGTASMANDDDGRSAGTAIEYISEKQLSTIIDYINSIADFNKEAFFKFMGIEELEKIPAISFNKAVTALKQAVEQRKRDKK